MILGYDESEDFLSVDIISDIQVPIRKVSKLIEQLLSINTVYTTHMTDCISKMVERKVA